MNRLHHSIKYTLQCLTAIFIGLSIDSDTPYRYHLIITLSILIAMKYDIPTKVIDTSEKYLKLLFSK